MVLWQLEGRVNIVAAAVSDVVDDVQNNNRETPCRSASGDQRRQASGNRRMVCIFSLICWGLDRYYLLLKYLNAMYLIQMPVLKGYCTTSILSGL